MRTINVAKVLLGCLLLVVELSVNAQHVSNPKISVVKFPIVYQGINSTVDTLSFPHRGPVLVSEYDVTGVYNDTTQTMTLTYHFTSDSTVVSIYRDFNRMLLDTVSVIDGQSVAYPLSGYGQGEFIFDIRRPRNDSLLVSYGSFSNIEMMQGGIGEMWPGTPYMSLGANKYNYPRTIHPYLNEDSIQYGYHASLGQRVKKTFCEQVTFQSKYPVLKMKCDSVDCFVYLFDPDSLNTFSYSKKVSKSATDSTSYRCVVQRNKPYILMAVAAEDVSGGTCSIVTKDFAFHHRPVYYNFYDLSVSANSASEQNIFATNWGHDLQLFVLRDRTATNPGKVRYCSTGYGSTPLYNWGTNPRVKAVFSSATTGLIVNDLTGDGIVPQLAPLTNIYAGCLAPTPRLQSQFSNNADIIENMMISAPINDRYLSWDWAVGEWNVKDHQDSPFHQFYGDREGPLGKADEIFFKQGYKRVAAGFSEAAIDVYGKVENGDTIVKHAAVRAYYTKDALGYDWESKLGARERVFHPRNGLGDRYVQRLASYVPMTMAEIAQGNSYEQIYRDYVYENAQLTNAEASVIVNATIPISYDDMDDFDLYYDRTADVLENSYESDYSDVDSCVHYANLLQLCQREPLLIYYAFLYVDEGEELAVKLIQDLMDVDNHPAMQAVRAYNRSHMYVGSGANRHKVRRTVQTNAVLFIKELLAMMNNQQQQAPPQGISYSNDEDAFAARANDGSIDVQFSLPEDATVSLCVATPDGSMIDQQIGGQRMEQGDHSRRIGVRKPGVYVVSYVVNGRIYNKKVSVK